jgi:N-acetylmuramoyl-L-alanine amidase
LNYAERARALLKDEFFLDVVKTQQELYIGNILNSSETDVDLRERSLIKHRAIAELVASLESIAAQTEIDKKRWKIF